MAKGQKRSNREPKKPKATKKPVSPPSALPQLAREPSRAGGIARKTG